MRSDLPWRWVALGVLLGCAADPVGPNDREQFAPPAEYRSWFASTEACSGLTGEFDRLQFFRVHASEFPCPSGMCVAHWTDDHRIFVAEPFVNDEMVIRHEMLHDLIGHPGHPDPPFGASACGLTWTTWSGRTVAAPRID